MLSGVVSASHMDPDSNWTFIAGNDVNSGAISSYNVTNWSDDVVFPQASVAVHSRIQVPGHPPENKVATTL